MVGFLMRAVISGLGLWVASQIFAGLHFESPQKLVVAAILLGVVNAFVRPLVFILTLPLTVLTLGLFLLVLNAAMVALVAWIVPGFTISGFWTAVGTSVIVGHGKR
jgi:putative membrane protein